MEQVVAEIACELAMRLMLEHGVHFQQTTADPAASQPGSSRPILAGPQLLGFAQVAWDAYHRVHNQAPSASGDASVREQREQLEAQLFHHLDSLPELSDGRSRRVAGILVEETLRHAQET